jgi:broad specificity phosphatase PhoE
MLAPASIGLSHLWIARHGQSAGTAAREAARASGAHTIDIEEGREMDVPLSALGMKQAHSLAAWFANQPERPTMIVTSPHLRAHRTAAAIAAAISSPVVLRVDERLREQEMGSLDRLTGLGIIARHPREAERLAQVGKFYYRPPGGESWCDVLLRVRSLIDHLRLVNTDQRVLLVAHQVIVLCVRWAVENLDENAILAIDSRADVVDCGVTSYLANREGALELTAFNFAAPLVEAERAVASS